MNNTKIGTDFEREAFDYLKKRFEMVEWLSEKKKSIFDFKCKYQGKIIYGDAKLVTNGKKATLRPSQRKADFLIVKIQGEVYIVWRKDFKHKVYLPEKKMETINTSFKTKVEFEKERNNFKAKENKQISQDEFVKELIKHWRIKE